MGKSIDILKEIKCDLIFILGDRYETFAMASAAYLLGIPIAHLHGGESSYGSLDDKLRHAITQLSTWHFTSSEKYKKKVILLSSPVGDQLAVHDSFYNSDVLRHVTLSFFLLL